MQLEVFRRDGIDTLLSWFKSNVDFHQWCGAQFKWPISQDQFQGYLEAMDQQPPLLYPFGFYQKDQLVGYCQLYGLHPEHQWGRLSCVVIDPKLRRKGYGAQMVRQVLNYGFKRLELNRISLGVFEQNTSALRLYREMGFWPEGTLREYLKVNRIFWDCHILSMLRKEWIQDRCRRSIQEVPAQNAYHESVIFNARA